MCFTGGGFHHGPPTIWGSPCIPREPLEFWLRATNALCGWEKLSWSQAGSLTDSAWSDEFLVCEGKRRATGAWTEEERRNISWEGEISKKVNKFPTAQCWNTTPQSAGPWVWVEKLNSVRSGGNWTLLPSPFLCSLHLSSIASNPWPCGETHLVVLACNVPDSVCLVSQACNSS